MKKLSMLLMALLGVSFLSVANCVERDDSDNTGGDDNTGDSDNSDDDDNAGDNSDDDDNTSDNNDSDEDDNTSDNDNSDDDYNKGGSNDSGEDDNMGGDDGSNNTGESDDTGSNGTNKVTTSTRSPRRTKVRKRFVAHISYNAQRKIKVNRRVNRKKVEVVSTKKRNMGKRVNRKG